MSDIKTVSQLLSRQYIYCQFLPFQDLCITTGKYEGFRIHLDFSQETSQLYLIGNASLGIDDNAKFVREIQYTGKTHKSDNFLVSLFVVISLTPLVKKQINDEI